MADEHQDLVRVDGTGTAHPVGRLASQYMRGRQGTFRVMPGPPHLVFMRHVGEDGVRDERDGAICRLAGEITAPADFEIALDMIYAPLYFRLLIGHGRLDGAFTDALLQMALHGLRRR